MTTGSTFNNQVLSYEPIVICDGATGSTRYIGTSLSFNKVNAPIWRIKKITVSGAIETMGYPNGDQGFNYAWSGRTGYTYQ